MSSSFVISPRVIVCKIICLLNRWQVFFPDAHSKTFLFIHKTYIGKFFEISRIKKVFDTGEEFYMAVLQSVASQLMADIGGCAPEVMCNK